MTRPLGRDNVTEVEAVSIPIRSRVWRFAERNRWVDGKWKDDHWGSFAEVSHAAHVEPSGDPSNIKNLRPGDSLFILAIPIDSSGQRVLTRINLTALFSRGDKHMDTKIYGTSPFWHKLPNGEYSYQAKFQRDSEVGWPETRATINELAHAPAHRAWYLGYRGEDYPADRMDLPKADGVHASGGFVFSFTASVDIHDRVTKKSWNQEFSFDPQMDVGGGDAQQ